MTYDWAILNLNWPCKKSDVLHGQKYSILSNDDFS